MARGAVSFGYFVRALKCMNKLVHCEPQQSRGTMVYLKLPRHPESNPATGLWEILAVPSPHIFKEMPKHDMVHDGKWVRGWGTFFKAVRTMKDPMGRVLFPKSLVEKLFSDPYDKFNSRQFKRDLNESNRPREARINDHLRWKV